MTIKFYKLAFLMAALLLVGCECPYLDEDVSPSYYYQNGHDRLTADRLPGLWQCYYPMYVGNVEFKEVRMYSNGKADIVMEDVGGSSYYAQTFKWRFDGRYITFTQGNTTYQFQITGFLSPELYLRDSRGSYTWAYRRTEDSI